MTQIRKRISFEFFKEQSDKIIETYEPFRRTWHGLHIYATDGDQYELPRSDDILDHGYRGYPCVNETETHYPHMYVVHCYDVLGGVTKEFLYSNKNREMHLAMEIASVLEPKSLTLYDRLFFCRDLMRAHQLSGSLFLARLKDSELALPEVIEFTNSSRRNRSFEFEGTVVQLVKVKNPRTNAYSVFATNLPRSGFKNQEIDKLYALRWEVETANRDMSHTLKVEQWHSRFLNGILQEIYATLWLMNQSRIQMAKELNKKCSLESLFDYAKSNFKLVADFVIDNLVDLVKKRHCRFNRGLRHILKISVENRTRRSRSYPRQTKYSRKAYPSASTVPRVK